MPFMNDTVSKSQMKREALALKKVGLDLVNLSVATLAGFPLDEALLKAILEAKTIKSFGAKKRQIQLIGKLLRTADSNAILQAYAAFQDKSSATTAEFQLAELWRHRLIQEGKEPLTEFIARYQPDVQKLKHLIKKATEDEQHQKNTGAALALFRYIRSCIA
jgi:ribosome-associated protein